MDLNIYSSDFILKFIQHNYPSKQVRSVMPYSFTVGSNNNGEPIDLNYGLERALFYGFLYLNINPNDNALQVERIRIRYRSYFNQVPFYKTITRYVENENLINENSSSLELFDDLQVTQSSTKYDFYLTFVGFKIDLI